MARVNILGDKKLVKKLKAMPLAIEKALKRELVIAGKIVESQAITLMISGPKTGRVYKVPGIKRKYTASRPGEAPAVATGILKNNVISDDRAVVSGKGFKVSVGTNIDYGEILETKKNRPWLVPALEITRNQNIRAITKGLKVAIAKAAKKNNGNGTAA